MKLKASNLLNNPKLMAGVSLSARTTGPAFKPHKPRPLFERQYHGIERHTSNHPTE